MKTKYTILSLTKSPSKCITLIFNMNGKLLFLRPTKSHSLLFIYYSKKKLAVHIL